MDRLRNTFSRPFPQVFLIFGISFLLYLILARPKGEINDLVSYGDNLYLANGFSGLRVVGIQDPNELNELGFYRCSGPFSKAQGITTNFTNCINRSTALALQNTFLYLVDQRSGLWVFDLQPDPTNPTVISQLRLSGRPQSIVVLDNFVYIASGRAGIQVIKTKETKPESGQPSLTPTSLDLSDQNVKSLEDVGNATAIYTDAKFLYWVERDNILHILTLKNPAQPKEIFTTKYDFSINDISFLGQYALIAAGKQGLVVLDKSNPEQPAIVTQLELGGSANSLNTQGNNAFVTVDGVGLTVVDITHINAPRVIPKSFPIGGHPDQLLLQGPIAYISNGSTGLIALETGIHIETETLGQSGSPVTAWGVETSGKYAYLASGERGLRVLDVTDPSRPNEVSFLDTAGEAFAVDVAGSSAFIADGKNGLVIANLAEQNNRLFVSKQIPSTDARDVAVSNSFAYVADYSDGLIIVNATEPTTASVVKIMDPPSDGAIHPLGVSVLGDYAYLANGDRGIAIVNVVDKSIPTIVQQVSIPGQADARSTAVLAYIPPDQLTPGADPFNADPSNPAAVIYAYVANGSFGLQLLDVSRPREKLAVQIPLDPAILTIPGEAVDVSISRDRAYVAYDHGGVAILNTINPAVPQLVGFVNLPQSENRAAGVFADSSSIYLAALNFGLQIIDATNTSNPVVVGKFSAPASVRNIAVQGNYAYTVDGVRGLWIFEITDPKFPQEIAFVSIPEANGVFVENEHAYVAAGSYGLRIVNINDPRNPIYEGLLDTPGIAQSILIINRPDLNPPRKYAYITDGQNGLVVVDVTDPQAPLPISSLSQVGNALRMVENGRDYLYIAAQQDGLVAVNVSDPKNPSLGDREQTGTSTRGVAMVQSQYAYTAAAENGLVIFDAALPLAFAPLEFNDANPGEWLENVSISSPAPIPGTITSTVTTAPTFAFLAERTAGMRILDTTNPIAPQRSGEWSADYSSAEMIVAPPEVVQIVSQWIPPVADGNEPGRFRMFVADSTHGFSIVAGVKNTKFEELGTYETKGAPSIALFLDTINAKLQGNPYPSEKVTRALQQLLLDIVLFGIIGFFCWIGFLALFVLPVSRFSDWENLYNRLLIYLFGRHGAAARVRGGKLIGTSVEIQKTGPGVFIVDSSSAVILEKRGIRGSRAERLPLVRVASSSVVYSGNRIYLTQPAYDEVLRGVADLRPQVRLAFNVNGYTRDGIEVETIIFTIFTLGEPAEVLRVAYIPPQTPPDGQENHAPYQPAAKDLRVITLRRSQEVIARLSISPMSWMMKISVRYTSSS